MERKAYKKINGVESHYCIMDNGVEVRYDNGTETEGM